MFEGQENKERDQDRVFDCFDHYKRWGYVLFPDNQKIYEHISAKIPKNWTVLEAGCGNGIGTGILAVSQGVCHVFGTDKLESNIKFAKALFPSLFFFTWDIAENPYHEKFDCVVCVETLEHVKDYRSAVKNLIASATKEVWISTPIPDQREFPPTNPYHVRDFSEEEVLDLIGDREVEVPFKGLFRIKL